MFLNVPSNSLTVNNNAMKTRATRRSYPQWLFTIHKNVTLSHSGNKESQTVIELSGISQTNTTQILGTTF
mgnify:FL=1